MKPVIIESIQSIELRAVDFGYGSGPKILNNVNFQVPLGENIWVTGQAGNGQSTFLKLLGVLLLPTSGAFLVNGHNTTEMSFEEFLPMRRKIGYTFDYGGLFANRTLHDNLMLPLVYHKICSIKEASEQVHALAERFSFTGQLHSRPASVSGGLRKLITVLRAFILRPEMIVMDDPFTGIDTESSKKMLQLISERKSTGELKHLYFTSRDEVWPERLGYKALIVEQGQPRIEESKKVAS